MISDVDAAYVLHGLEYGFDLGVNHEMLRGKRVHKNYNTAFENKDKLHKALSKRVAAGKTIRLGAFDGTASGLPEGPGLVVPQGAVAKKLEPDTMRPISDHTKTGFNGAVDMTPLVHTLDTYNEIARELKPGYFMRVEDVDAAFPNLPLAPSVWKYMYVWWYDENHPLSEQTGPNTLYVHVFADFGRHVWDMQIESAWALDPHALRAESIVDGPPRAFRFVHIRACRMHTGRSHKLF